MAKVQFARRVRFTASHHYELKQLSRGENAHMFGEANQVHEHTWELTIWVEGPVDAATGMMVDLPAIDRILEREVVAPFHQKHINEVDPFFENRQPTTEVLASYFANRLMPHLEGGELVRLRIAECEDLFAEWHR